MEQLFNHVDKTLHSLLAGQLSGPTRFALEAQIKGLRKRVTSAKDAARKRETALKTFWDFHASEVVCDLSNPILVRARSLIRSWCALDVGPADSMMTFDAVEQIIADHLTPGPGAAVSGTRSTSPFLKRSSPFGFSSREAALEYAALSHRHRPDLFRALKVCQGFVTQGRVTTVLKDEDTDRVIAIEPSGNVELQHGLAAVLTLILSRLRVNLDTQPEVNRYLARLGSLGHGYGTIDLSRASDSLSHALLEFLLPEWLWKSVQLYSTPLPVPGRVVLTMGNAITFPLQTMIFLAISCAGCAACGVPYKISKNVTVFGDDIVVPSSAYQSVLRALVAAGCTPNVRKSFNEGPFRESCGLDCYFGYSVRPFCPRINLDEVTDQSIAYFVNGMCAWAYKVGLDIEPASLIRFARRRKIPFVPMHAPIDSGIRVTRAIGQAAFRGSIWTIPILAAKPTRRRRARWNSYTIQAMLAGYIKSSYILERQPTKVVASEYTSSLPWDWCNPDDRRHYDGLGFVA